jgi:uncharacterized protein (DUF2147 family)
VTILAIALALAGASPAVTGDWISADGSALVHIAPCGTKLCGTIVRVLARGPNVPRNDVNNSAPALRSRPLVGLAVLYGFSRSNSGWDNGRAYDPKTGRSYRSSLSVGEDHSLIVTGCILFICKSQRWTRPR